MRAIYYFFPSFFNRPSGALYPPTPNFACKITTFFELCK